MKHLDTYRAALRNLRLVHNALRRMGLETIGQLIQKTPQDILRIRNLGRESLNDIKEVLSEMGLSLAPPLNP